MNSVLEKGRTTAGQGVLVTLHDQLKMLGTPPLGPDFIKKSGTLLTDCLVIHRLTAKFEVPEGDKSDAKKRASIQKMLDYDASYDEVKRKLFPTVDSTNHFLAARAWMHTTLRGFKPANIVQFPGKEGVNPSEGYVDLYYKLVRDQHWTVSADCVRQASKLAYNTRSLRRVAITRFKQKALDDPRIDLRRRWVDEARAKKRYIGFYVFDKIFRTLVEITGFSRLTTVPKNNKEERVITCEPTWNLIVQRSIALGLLACVRKETGVDIPRLQEIHRSIIRDRKLATVDFSKASDSNWFPLFKMLFPDKVVRAVSTARTGLLSYEGDYYPLNSVAPMGSGFTFEIMTLTLMAYARVFDPYATVFGDDVLICQKQAQRFCVFVEQMGWKVNSEKSFLEGNFSESCGGFYNHSTGEHIVSHDLFYPKTFADILAATNKLSNILTAGQVGPIVRKYLLAAYVSLLRIVPSVAYTHVRVRQGEEASHVWVPKSIPLESFRPKSQLNYNHDLQRGNDYGRRLVFKPTVEYDILDEVSGVVLACYMYHGRKTVGPRSGALQWQSYLR